MIGMQEFTLFMLQAVANFLAAETVIYLFGTIIFIFILKGIKALISL